MVIPERTRRVHKVVVPFFLLKMGGIFLSLSFVLLIIVGIDYIHVLGRLAENKQLKGENFKLRQEIQVIRGKVDNMESTIERVRNYAKKLQILTGQGGKSAGKELPQGPIEEGLDRAPASSGGRRSQLMPLEPDFPVPRPVVPDFHGSLSDRVEKLQLASLTAEEGLSKLQVYLLAKSAVISATPSFLPIAGWMSSSFGYRRHPYDGSFRLHTGVDLAAEPGTPVRVTADGLVIYAGYREGYGKVIVVDHGYGIHTLYAHLSKQFVTQGARVKRGQLISAVGSTGQSTGPHLHYEIRKNGIPVNPMTF